MEIQVWLEPAFMVGVGVRSRWWVVFYLGFIVIGVGL